MATSIGAQLPPRFWMLCDSLYGCEDFVAELDTKSRSLAIVVFDGFAKLPSRRRQKADVQVRPNSANTSLASVDSISPAR